MSAQRKQYADLIRHRELNALRRLMVGRHVPSPSLRPTQPGQILSQVGMPHTVMRIDELEQQMNQMLLERAMTTQAAPNSVLPSQPRSFAAHKSQGNLPSFEPFGGEFLQTQIAPRTQIPTSGEAEQAVIAQAAALFAHGSDLEANQLLLAAVRPGGSQHDHVPTWLVLFDFYRATAQAAPFDALALDFSVRFGRSTPAWLSLPSLLPTAPSPAAALIAVAWQSPAYLDEPSAIALTEYLNKAVSAGQALTLDWRAITDVQPAAWPVLKLFWQTLAATTCPSTVAGLAALELTFTDGLADSMLTKLALLRCLNQPEAFEALALDYCTVFEVSPPDWVPAKHPISVQDLSLGTQHSTAASANLSTTSWELAGEVAILPVLFQSEAPSNEKIEVRCDRLLRITPAATQSLKLWTQAAKQRGIPIVLQDVHRVVAAYLLSQGVYESAKVAIRRD